MCPIGGQLLFEKNRFNRGEGQKPNCYEEWSVHVGKSVLTAILFRHLAVKGDTEGQN